MAGIGSPAPYIKDEPEDFQFENSRFMSAMNGSNHFQGQQYGNWQGNMGTETLDYNIGGHSMRGNFGSGQNLSSSFIAGNSAVLDDELADLLESDSTADLNSNNYEFQSKGFSAEQISGSAQGTSTVPVHQRNSYMGHVFSQTPEGSGPINSPWENGGFDYSQYVAQQPQRRAISSHRQPSANVQRGSFDMNSRVRNSLQQERASSTSRSPMTPKTPGLIGAYLGTPDSIPLSGQAIPGSHLNHAHRKTPSAHWDNTFSSGPSYADSPLSSPNKGSVQVQISDVVNGNKTSTSVTTKVEPGAQSAPPTTVDAKRQKRRQSHNAVERRRRDNINDRIQDLARLVPAHRLEDDKLKKHLTSSSPFPPTSLSPPQATSLLAGGTGKRAASSISQGLPIDEKDKGPAKGDVLNGAVSWTRDLMWILDRQIMRENVFVEMMNRHGEQLPQHLLLGDDERRMQSEVLEAGQKNGVSGFTYSRANGTGLFVPAFTDHAGNNLQSNAEQTFSNPFMNTNTGVDGLSNDAQMWGYNNLINDDEFKEEDEFGMEM